MVIEIKPKHFLAKPGKVIRLADWDPSDTSAFHGNEEVAKDVARKIDSKLDRLQEMLFGEHKHKLLIVLQSVDTGGKDGTIRRVFEGVNPSGVRVSHFRTPSQDEIDHGFLWRAYAQIPSKGEIVIFNRSYYEGVLVERIHRIVPEETWKKRYEEIRSFEKLLVSEGVTIIKFFLHISSEEQKKRMTERLTDPSKAWKLSQNDLMERKLWSDYTKAYEDLLTNTSTKYSPWYIVPSNHKWFRDLIVASIIVQMLEHFDMKYPKLAPELRSMKIS